MALRLDETAMMDTLNVLLLSHPGSAEELAVINEINPACVKISSTDGPGKMDSSIAVLSWRWDILKQGSLEDMRSLVSPKIVKFIKMARELGFKWAWCDYATVPQFGEDRDELMRHIQSSRTLYQRCTVLVVDVVEVWPGISVPTMDFQTRLWIAAEKSAVLSNPNVSLSTYVQLSRLTQMSIALLIEAPWSPETGMPMSMYQWWLETLLGTDIEQQNHTCGHLRKLGFPFQLVATRGYTILERSYPGLCAWLGTYFAAKLSPTERVEDESHEHADFEMAEEEQADLIAAYWTVEPDRSAGASPGAKIRTPMRAAHPAVKALLDAQQRSAKMPRDFRVREHYAGFLLLASELAYAYMAERKFDPAVFENLMVNLGEHPTIPAPEPDAPYALKAFMRSDFVVVREMILADSGLSLVPCSLRGVDFPDVPRGHKVSVTIMPPELSFEQLVMERLELVALDFAARPDGCAWKVMVSANAAAGVCYLSLTVEGPRASVTVSDGGMPTGVVTFSANDGLEKTRAMGAYTLANDEAFLIVSANLTDMSDSSKSKQALLYVPAANVTTETVRALVGAVLAFSKSDALATEPKARLDDMLKQMPAAAGMRPNFAAAETATAQHSAGTEPPVDAGGPGNDAVSRKETVAPRADGDAAVPVTSKPAPARKVGLMGGMRKLFSGGGKGGAARK